MMDLKQHIEMSNCNRTFAYKSSHRPQDKEAKDTWENERAVVECLIGEIVISAHNLLISRGKMYTTSHAQQ
jgi:hypothetical protein